MQIKLKKPNTDFLKNLISLKTLSLIKREISGYFSTPVGYIIFSLFIITLYILLFALSKFTQFGTAELTQMFTFLAFTFTIIVPALTMSSISKEKQLGTIEYILTQPITELQFLISKFISYSILVVLMILSTLPLAFIIGGFKGLDIGQAIMQYIGAIILALCFVAIGIFSSSLFKNEISSFLTSLVISALFIIFGSDVITFLPPDIVNFLNKFSLLTHYQSISRGVLDFRDVLYFIAFIFGFLLLAYYLIIKEKYPKKNTHLRNTQIITLILLVLTFGIGFLGQIIPGRIDFTSDKRYTLSDASIGAINGIKDRMDIILYASSNLPLEFQTELRNLNDILRDYVTASGGKINLEVKQPDKDENVKNEAKEKGITEIDFNVKTGDSAQVVIGYFGLTFKAGDKFDVININSETINDLEFQITKKIKKVSGATTKKIGFVANNVLNNRASTLQKFATELAELYEVSDVTLTKDAPEIPKDLNAIIISSPSDKFDDKVLANLKKYYENGGSIFLMTETTSVQQDQTVVKNENSLKDLFVGYGVTLNENLVYDLKNNNIVALQSNSFAPQVINYPFWIISTSTNENSSILKDVPGVSLLWASSVSIDSSKLNGATATKLLVTSEFSNTQNPENANIAFDQEFARKADDSSQTVAVALENKNGGRAVIIGDSDFLIDDMLSALVERQSQDKLSLGFGLNSVTWMVKDDSIGSIISKNRVAPLLNFEEWQKVTLVVGSVAIPLIAIIGFGLVKFYLRSRLVRKSY